jgi:hypothetical protein
MKCCLLIGGLFQSRQFSDIYHAVADGDGKATQLSGISWTVCRLNDGSVAVGMQAQLELATRAASQSEVVALEADGRLREAGRQLLDLQQRCDELLQKCEGLEKDKQQAEAAAAATVAAEEVGGASDPCVTCYRSYRHRQQWAC